MKVNQAIRTTDPQLNDNFLMKRRRSDGGWPAASSIRSAIALEPYVGSEERHPW